MADFSLRDKVFYGAGDVLHWHIRIDPVLVEQIDAVGLEALQRSIRDFADAFRPAIDTLRRNPVLEAKLRGDDDVIAHRGEGLAQQLLILERAIGFGRVEECDAPLKGGADQRDAVVFLDGWSIPKAEPHATQAEG
jgi:hypothetical protein